MHKPILVILAVIQWIVAVAVPIATPAGAYVPVNTILFVTGAATLIPLARR